MAEPTPAVRAVTYERDGHRCVSCTRVFGLQYQHRGATGQGGSKVRPRLEEGVTACGICNEEFEGRLQTVALMRGWKVRRWVQQKGQCGLVPVFYTADQMWFVLTGDGLRVAISPAAAAELMRDVYGDEWDRWVSEVAA